MDAGDAWETAAVVAIVVAAFVLALLVLAALVQCVLGLARWFGSGQWRKDLWR